VVVSAGYLAGTLALGLLGNWSLVDIVTRALLGGVNAFVSASLSLLILPPVESLTRITTDLTLLELSDPSRPLLRRMSLEAPGTYAHSIAMANLVEAACNRVGSAIRCTSWRIRRAAATRTIGCIHASRRRSSGHT
jgi:membrane-associated HD superfamily phosphohydrolase